MTPEERAAAEIAEKLGFKVRLCEEEGCTQAVGIDKRGAHAHWPRYTFDLWSLALRQGVELNKLSNRTPKRSILKPGGDEDFQ